MTVAVRSIVGNPLLHRCRLRLCTVERILYRVSVVGNQPLAIDFFASQANLCACSPTQEATIKVRPGRSSVRRVVVARRSLCGSLDGIRGKSQAVVETQAVLPRLAEEPIRFAALLKVGRQPVGVCYVVPPLVRTMRRKLDRVRARAAAAHRLNGRHSRFVLRMVMSNAGKKNTAPFIPFSRLFFSFLFLFFLFFFPYNVHFWNE